MRPSIGITPSVSVDSEDERFRTRLVLNTAYLDAIQAVGGAAVILPVATDEIASEILDRLDGLILSGGGDIPPQFFGGTSNPKCHYIPEERWRSECLWLRKAQEAQVPVLGICLGIQVITVAAGGTLIQDIPSEYPRAITHDAPGHMQQHPVNIEAGSQLASMAPSLTVIVTSAHHQAVNAAARGYRVVAKAPDGLIEAIERDGPAFVLGVQWHPERCLDQPNWLLRGFVRRCARHTRQRPEGIEH